MHLLLATLDADWARTFEAENEWTLLAWFKRRHGDYILPTRETCQLQHRVATPLGGSSDQT